MILASPLLFPFALLLHVVVRPRITVEEERLSRLRDAALEAELEVAGCPACRKPVDDDWLVCPQLPGDARPSLRSMRPAVGIDWDACAWCGASFEPPPGTVLTDR